MKPIAAIAWALAIVSAREVRALSGETVSASGQFIVSGPALVSASLAMAVAPDSGIVELQPPQVAVSCEYIKQALWRQLGADASWSGTVYLGLHPTRFPDERPVLFARKFGDHWIYRLDMPNRVDQNRYVRAIVQAVLLERANRSAGARSAEIPDWLAEGLAQNLIASDGTQILPSPPEQVRNNTPLNWRKLDLSDAPLKPDSSVQTRKLNPLGEAQATLRSRPPLTFQELSWPDEGQFFGEPGKIFRSSAQLFVTQLLGLKDGPACFIAMLNDLPRRYNWQFSFLGAFGGYFQTPLDVEKWWALQIVQFTGRDLTQMWTTEETWKKLEEILFAPAELRTKSDELPSHTAVTLQTIIQQLKPDQQIQALEGRLVKLDALRLRASPDVLSLLDDYREVVRTYLAKRSNPRGFLFFRRPASGLQNLVRATAAELDGLDSRREALRMLGAAPVAAAAGVGSDRRTK